MPISSISPRPLRAVWSNRPLTASPVATLLQCHFIVKKSRFWNQPIKCHRHYATRIDRIRIPDIPIAKSILSTAIHRHYEHQDQGHLSDPTRIAVFSQNGQQFTYRQLVHDACVLAQRISETLNQATARGHGHHIALLAPPNYDFVVAQLAVWFSGNVLIPISPASPAQDIQYYIQHAQCTLCLVHPNLTKHVEELKKLGVVNDDTETDEVTHQTPRNDDKRVPVMMIPKHSQTNSSTVSSEALGDVQFYNMDMERPSTLIFTSGTTNRPKAAVHTHRSIHANLESMKQSWKWTSNDHILNVLPLHHVHGLVNVVTSALYNGASLTMFDKFNAEQIWNAWCHSHERKTFSLFMAVPTIYAKLLSYYHSQTPETQERLTNTCSQFRLMVSGSASLPDRVFKDWERISGHRLLERYGMTEIGMALTNPLKPPSSRKPGTVGFPFPNVSVKLSPSNEVLVKGPNLFTEYYNNPIATKETFNEEGWFQTGDIAELDSDGYYRIVGRASVDIIKSKGYKIGALEIEREIMDVAPDVNDVAVLGIPDDVQGELLVAVVVLKSVTSGSHSQLTKEEIMERLKTKLPMYKVPSVWMFLKEMPRNAMGKVNKKSLREFVTSNPEFKVVQLK